jgi:hypothetical protein
MSPKLEQRLFDLKTMAGLLEHMATSERTSADCGLGRELGHIQTVLMQCHEDISTVWDSLGAAGEPAAEHAAEVAELKAELAACIASHGPPGSKADIKHAQTCWHLLISAARTVTEEARDAGLLPPIGAKMNPAAAKKKGGDGSRREGRIGKQH